MYGLQVKSHFENIVCMISQYWVNLHQHLFEIWEHAPPPLYYSQKFKNGIIAGFHIIKVDGVQVCIMGLLTQEPGEQKDSNKIYKIPMFG